ncbi:MAG: LytTR family DNA-binding domain-containing protein [Oscillospiraceae bacterium]|nr:LytTR family DNA-binding domain-containing protein [Oscillospiraceae bacterium]
MRIAICEDDAVQQERLTTALKDWAGVRKVNADILCYSSAEEFLFAWSDISFDLAFLDIQMKNIDGIELAETIRKTDSNMLIVFVTSYKEYVLKGYDINALHYLIKPISPAKLLPVLDRAHLIIRSRNDDIMILNNHSGKVKVPFADINYISIMSHTVRIHTNKEIFEKRITMSELHDLLPGYFIRTHRSYIVNLFKADCVYKESLLLSTGEELPISRKNTKEVNNAFVRLHVGR